MVPNQLFTLILGLVYQTSATYDECMQNGGKEITVDICIPPRYDSEKLPQPSSPKSPFTVHMILKVTGFKKVDLLSNTFSLNMILHRAWTDSRIQINWDNNDTVKYSSDEPYFQYTQLWLLMECK